MPARPAPDPGASAGMIVLGESLDVLRALPDCCAGLVYADPPFNTGAQRNGLRVRVRAAADGARTGFGGRRYHSEVTHGPKYGDSFSDYLGWLRPRLVESRRILDRHGSLYLHVDPRESHYCKVLCDELFGRRCFLNEVIWAYDYGGRSGRRWAAKHDVILVYVRNPSAYHFDTAEIERIPYLAPQLQTPERAALGKLPTDVWWHTIVPTTSRERTGYPTQKPLGIMRRVVAASSRRGDLVVDWCAGSGTTGVAAAEVGRRYLLVDDSESALEVMASRLPQARALRNPDRSALLRAAAAASLLSP